MEKGKFLNKKNHISILVVPHSSSDVKVMRFTALYSKLAVFLVSFSVIILAVVFTISYLISYNLSLKSNIADIKENNLELKSSLDAKNKQITSLAQKDSKKDEQIKSFMDKYKEITDTYITGKSNSIKINRSGNRVDRNFMKDINNLKEVLDNLSKLDSPEYSVPGILTKTEIKLNKYIDSTPNLWPTSGSISSRFGERTDPIVWKKSFHDGLDIAAPYGQQIKAAGTGTVTKAGWTSVYGNTLIISHGHGISSFYGHCSKLLVKVGENVNKGDIVALVGSTGRSTGSHLHFGIFVDGTPVDPLKCLN